MDLFVGILQLVQPPVESALSEQLVMRTRLSQLAVMKDHDAVALLNCGKTMCDDHRSAALHYTFDGLLDKLFGFSVN